MTKKKKAVRRPPRRSTYETALDHAATRLEKAVQERTAALMKLDELAREIPYLENIVQALTPRTEAKPVVQAQAVYPPPEPIPPTPEGAIMDQEAYLERFMPRTGRITTAAPPVNVRPQPDGSSPDPDEFLKDDIGGHDILS